MSTCLSSFLRLRSPPPQPVLFQSMLLPERFYLHCRFAQVLRWAEDVCSVAEATRRNTSQHPQAQTDLCHYIVHFSSTVTSSTSSLLQHCSWVADIPEIRRILILYSVTHIDPHSGYSYFWTPPFDQRMPDLLSNKTFVSKIVFSFVPSYRPSLTIDWQPLQPE